MDLQTFEDLLSPQGESALAAAADLSLADESFLNTFEKLRKRFPHALARAVLDTLLLRAKAREKFSLAHKLFFTRESLEQSSSETVARYRTQRFAGYSHVADLCCGIGGDAMAFAAQQRVTAIDSNELCSRMALVNIRACGLSADVVCADVLQATLPNVDAAFCDPGRRAHGARFLRLADYLPPPRAVMARFPNIPLAFKLAPGLPRQELDAYDGEAEFVSLDGELKECILWLGAFRTTRRRATVLPSGESLIANPLAKWPDDSEPRAYLYDPDAAVSRSDLMAELALQLNAKPLDTGIALLTADTLMPTPFATAYSIDEALPFHAKRLGEALRSRGIGRVTILKRGVNADVNELMKRWKLGGGEHRHIVLTPVQGVTMALLVRPVATIASL